MESRRHLEDRRPKTRALRDSSRRALTGLAVFGIVNALLFVGLFASVGGRFAIVDLTRSTSSDPLGPELFMIRWGIPALGLLVLALTMAPVLYGAWRLLGKVRAARQVASGDSNVIEDIADRARESKRGLPPLVLPLTLLAASLLIIGPFLPLAAPDGYPADLSSGTVLMLLSGVIFVFTAIAMARQRTETTHAIVRSAPTRPSAATFAALETASLAAGSPMPRLRLIDSAAANALIWVDGAPVPIVALTRGMQELLTPGQLEVVFANVLARAARAVIAQNALAATLPEERMDARAVDAATDAQTLLWIRDPARVLSAMSAVAEADTRLTSPGGVPDECFYCRPHGHNGLHERIRRVVRLAGHEGALWWAQLREERMAQAAEDMRLPGDSYRELQGPAEEAAATS